METNKVAKDIDGADVRVGDKLLCVRIAADGVTRERFDHFCEEWVQMPSYWTDYECRQFCASLVGASTKSVRVEGRAK